MTSESLFILKFVISFDQFEIKWYFLLEKLNEVCNNLR